MSGGTIADVDAVVRRLVLPHERGLRLVVIGFSPYMLSDAHPLDSRAARYLWSLGDALSNARAGDPLGPEGAAHEAMTSQVRRRLALLRRRDELRNAVAEQMRGWLGFSLITVPFRSQMRFNGAFDEPHGYAPRGVTMRHRLTDRPDESVTYPPLAGFDRSERRAQVLVDLVGLLDSGGVQVFVVRLPVSSRLERLWTPEIRRATAEFLEQLEVAHASVISVDREGVGLTDRDFYNLDHLAPEAALRFTSELAGRIGEGR